MLKGRKLIARIVLTAVVLFSASFFTLANQQPVSAGSSSSTFCSCKNTYSDGSVVTEQGSDAMVFGDSNGCYCAGPKGIMRIGINIFTGFLVVAGTIGIIFAGILYMTARDSEDQLIKAKKRLMNVIIGIVGFGLLDVIANFILPTGLTDNQPYVVSSVSSRVDRPEETPATPAKKNSYSQIVDVPSPKDRKNHTFDTSDQNTPKNTTCKDGAKVSKTVNYKKQFLDKNGLIQWKGGNTTCWRKNKKTGEKTVSRWKKNHNIGCSACPMIAALNAVNQLTGCNYSQQNFADYMKSYTKNWTKRRGLFLGNAAWSNVGQARISKHYVEAYGLHAKLLSGNKKNKTKEALKKGHVVIVSGPSSGSDKIYGGSGHYVLFAEYNSSKNKVRIVNASGSNNSTFNSWYDWDFATKRAVRYLEVWK